MQPEGRISHEGDVNRVGKAPRGDIETAVVLGEPRGVAERPDLLIPEPLGSIPLAMLLVAALTSGGARLFGRLVWVYPVLAAFVGSVLADVVSLSLMRLVAAPLGDGLPLELILPAAALNAAICGVLLFPVRTLALRYWLDEKPAW